MKFVNRIKDNISAWLYDKLVPDPPEDCPFRDKCREDIGEEMLDELDIREPVPWSDLD